MKIGIITHYYNNSNYGGQLQAYALVKLLKKNGYYCEQISYDMGFHKKRVLRCFIRKLIPGVMVRFVKIKILKKPYVGLKPLNKKTQKAIKLRKKATKNFENNIPHSAKVFNFKNISKVNDLYDVFITGSDQVWNVNWFVPAFFLEFADANKKKISYAASMPKTNLTKEQEAYLIKTLKEFDGISVREDISRKYLSNLLNQGIEQVLDPTLMLNKDDWDKISTDRIIKEKYVFCYFLGGGNQKRDLAQFYAKKINCKLVTIPYLSQHHRDDENFGDYPLYKVSPCDFISLVKYAEYVFTDSFHVAVFSNIYEKEFCVIDRCNKGEEYMRSRIKSLLNTFCEAERLVGEDCTIDNIENFNRIDYKKVKEIIKVEQKKSLEFLINSLNN